MKSFLVFILSLLTLTGLRAANPSFKDLVWTNDPGGAHLRSNVTRFGFSTTNTSFYNDPSKQTVGVGYDIFQGGTPDFNNTAFGYQCLNSLVTGQENLAAGTFALNAATNSQWNTALGYLTLNKLKKGSGNLAIGASVLENLEPTTVGDGTDNPGENIGIGYQVGQVLFNGQKNILIGPFSNLDDGASSNNVVIGHSALGNLYDIVIGLAAQSSSGATASTNIVIGHSARGRRYDLVIGYGVDASSAARLNTLIGHNITVASGKSNTVAVGFKSSVGADNTVQLGNGLTEMVRTAGRAEFTNGYASFSSISTNAIGTTGYTNNQAINQTAYVTATAVAFTIKDRSGNALYVSPTLTATMPVNLQPGWAITAASGLVGTVLPW